MPLFLEDTITPRIEAADRLVRCAYDILRGLPVADEAQLAEDLKLLPEGLWERYLAARLACLEFGREDRLTHLSSEQKQRIEAGADETAWKLQDQLYPSLN